MKAKDLAALAALGVAGYAAYDKFGKKGEEPKTRGKLGESQSANDGTAGEYRSDMLGKGRSANEGDAGEAEAGMVSMSPTSRNRVDRAAEMEAEYGPQGSGGMQPNDVGQGGSQSAAAVAAGKSLNSQGGPSRYRAAQDSQAASSAAPVTSSAPVVGRVGTQPAMDAYSRATRPAAGNQAMAAMERATVPNQSSAASGNAAMGAYNQVRTVPRNIQYATEAEKARQARIDERNYDSDLMKSRRQAVVDTVKNIPANVMNAFSMPEKTFQNKTYVKDGKVVRYAKGGVVKKMSSGGMSSKPSSASSRGDGIAQRGKTRGMIR
jgi:hypothetical protein